MKLALHEARKMWMALGSDLRQRVMDGETIKVAARSPVKSFNEMLAPLHEVEHGHLVHSFRSIRTISFVGAIVTIYADDQVIHVLKQR